ncbi:nicotinate-nucleotide--dimethylbenzimidazole phosphoribosyltransferase [Alkalibaculum sp. M08DMB]|uniref:Nicotinate-nucleotide--dimethylbenzimidazole phosphoribosyltransferase n=1 Tax=Alkalibaculum sporogenes TaxID=2655001 RepID=A0A6A7KC40_9FIRM|nr:nicotinate-nucleotide--dimethylbenzimidazole phosphoribosyltransferase [Alkalibaculum sporogenes]MPW27100.1 nicotinate-nucleotide--dimethylbenzimidazole phosphoribosyltransferase [Alkalibaculum sporogenes]
MSKLYDIINNIKPIDLEWKEKAHEYLETLAIPYWSLGELLNIAEQLCGIQRTLKPSVSKKCIIVMAGDHGVVDEGVSAFPQEVTPQMISNFVRKGASINALSDVVGSEVVVVDVGVAVDMPEHVANNSIISAKVAYGTKNMLKGPAMTREEAEKSILAGIEVVEKVVKEKGTQLIATGDMGIGNTTPSSAILAVMTGQNVSDITGKGTGIDEGRLINKISVIEKAIQLNAPDPKDPIDVLSKVGGFEIGGIAGIIIGASYYKVPVVVDGLISTAGALIAKALNPNVVDYMIAAHKSMEPGHEHMWKSLNLKPLLDLKFRLGEGTGAALAMNIVEGAAQVIDKVLTFEDANVSQGE